MSVYEQIASRTRSRRHRKTVNDIKLDEQAEEIEDDDDDDRSSIALQVRFNKNRFSRKSSHLLI
jgi:hypothetical protein